MLCAFVSSLFLMLNCVLLLCRFALGLFWHPLSSPVLLLVYYRLLSIHISRNLFLLCFHLMQVSLDQIIGFWIWLTTKQVFLFSEILLYVIIYLYCILIHNLKGHPNAFTCKLTVVTVEQLTGPSWCPICYQSYLSLCLLDICNKKACATNWGLERLGCWPDRDVFQSDAVGYTMGNVGSSLYCVDFGYSFFFKPSSVSTLLREPFLLF